MRILILGLDGAGKTTILYRLQVGEVVTTIPSKKRNNRGKISVDLFFKNRWCSLEASTCCWLSSCAYGLRKTCNFIIDGWWSGILSCAMQRPWGFFLSCPFFENNFLLLSSASTLYSNCTPFQLLGSTWRLWRTKIWSSRCGIWEGRLVSGHTGGATTVILTQSYMWWTVWIKSVWAFQSKSWCLCLKKRNWKRPHCWCLQISRTCQARSLLQTCRNSWV